MSKKLSNKEIMDYGKALFTIVRVMSENGGLAMDHLIEDPKTGKRYCLTVSKVA